MITIIMYIYMRWLIVQVCVVWYLMITATYFEFLRDEAFHFIIYELFRQNGVYNEDCIVFDDIGELRKMTSTGLQASIQNLFHDFKI